MDDDDETDYTARQQHNPHIPPRTRNKHCLSTPTATTINGTALGHHRSTKHHSANPRPRLPKVVSHRARRRFTPTTWHHPTHNTTTPAISLRDGDCSNTMPCDMQRMAHAPKSTSGIDDSNGVNKRGTTPFLPIRHLVWPTTHLPIQPANVVILIRTQPQTTVQNSLRRFGGLPF